MKVFAPRGKRADGGGLVAQVVISQEEVDRWLGLYGAPSAQDRASFARRFDRVTLGLRREVEARLGEVEAERVARERFAREAAADMGSTSGSAGGSSETGGSDEPGEPVREEAVPAPANTAQVMATAGPIAQGTEGDPT